jgi:hypothetical protein
VIYFGSPLLFGLEPGPNCISVVWDSLKRRVALQMEISNSGPEVDGRMCGDEFPEGTWYRFAKTTYVSPSWNSKLSIQM